MIYWFTGPFGIYRDELALKFYEFIKTQKRNWRKNVFLVTSVDSPNDDYAKFLVDYLHKNECDIVVSLQTSSLKEREAFKSKFYDTKFQEIYVHSDEFMTSDYEVPQNNYIQLNSDKDSVTLSFSKLLVELETIKKL